MQLLVSVRSAAEVGAALSGGADIIDAKEPKLGSLGPVSSDVLGAILDRVPPLHETSVALGDFSRPHDVQAAIQSLPLAGRQCATYLKLGFAGVSGEDLIATLLESAVATSRSHLAQPRIVAVAYADAEEAGTAPPKVISRAAARPDIVGFRGAACAGGRVGRVSSSRVRQLSEALRKEGSGSIQELVPSP